MLNVYVWGSTVTRARFLDGAAEVNQCGGGHGTLKTHWVFFFFAFCIVYESAYRMETSKKVKIF